MVWVKSGQHPHEFQVCDLTQRVQYSKGTRRVMMCLLKRSLPWTLHGHRCLLPREALGVMGMNSPPFESAILDGQLSHSDVRAFAGNGMHCMSLAAAYTWGAMQL